MPELPEVETVCRVLRAVLVGRRVAQVDVIRDPIVFSNAPPKALKAALLGRTVSTVGRRGKLFWLTFHEPGPTLFGHLGMSGWIREVGGERTRLLGHGDAPLDDEAGRPRFLRLLVAVEGGSAIALTDPRRLGRVWLGEGPEDEPRVRRLGRDAYDDLPSLAELRATFERRAIPIKALLLDQTVLAGIGNWIADEVLYQAHIAPKRAARSLDAREVSRLRRAITSVLRRAVEVSADHRAFPKSWLFAHRWGGSRGVESIRGERIVREVVGGRTTAWVPSRQR